MKQHFFPEDEALYHFGTSPNSIVNVFVPYDCYFHCPFCTTKEWYKDINIGKWWESFNRVLRNKPKVIMLTGGEPITDLEFLDQILVAIDKSNFPAKQTSVYVNTSFIGATGYLEKAACVLIDHHMSIKGINISRHKPSEISHREWLRGIIPIRVNILIQGENFNPVEHIKFWAGKHVEISFREDYKNVTQASLFDFSSPVLKYLTENCILQSTNYCHFCNNLTFWDARNNLSIRYHRGLPYTSAKIGTLAEHMEAILAPNGELYSDWDCSSEGIDALLPLH